MLEQFEMFEIVNPKVIYGGDHADTEGIPNDNTRK